MDIQHHYKSKTCNMILQCPQSIVKIVLLLLRASWNVFKLLTSPPSPFQNSKVEIAEGMLRMTSGCPSPKTERLTLSRLRAG